MNMVIVKVVITARQRSRELHRKFCLFHLSKTINGPLIRKMIPRIPDFIGENEDESIPRISFARSIGKCLSGISVPNITIEGRLFRVYGLPGKISDYEHIVPTKEHVFDSEITNEIWITEIVRPVYIGVILVTKIKYQKFTENQWKIVLKNLKRRNMPTTHIQKLYNMYVRGDKINNRTLEDGGGYVDDYRWIWAEYNI